MSIIKTLIILAMLYAITPFLLVLIKVLLYTMGVLFLIVSIFALKGTSKC